MADKTKARIAGVIGEATALLWGAYSTMTTVAQLPADVGALAAVIADPPIYLPWLAAAGFLLVLGWGFWPNSDREKRISDGTKAPGTVHVDQRVSSVNQQGGVTAHTVIAPPERGLDASSRARLLELVPTGQPVEIEAPVNDPEAGQLAEQIAKHLQANGYHVAVALAMGRPFPRGVEVAVLPDRTAISVGRR